MSARASGDDAEASALAFLQKKGLVLLRRNYRCRLGEVDLIMQDGAFLVFVEVRRRSSLAAAAASIDATKQLRLRRAAAHYLSAQDNGAPPQCRFDAALLDERRRVRWIRGAFEDALAG